MNTHTSPSARIATTRWRVIALGVALTMSVGIIALSSPDSYAPQIPAISVWAGNCFAANTLTSAPPGIQSWVSRNQQDSGTGRLVLGPFIAPETISLSVVGYPNYSGNRLYVESVLTEETKEIEGDGAEHWHDLAVSLPGAWVGTEIRLIAIDNATGPKGWLGISEPYDPNKQIVGVRLTTWAKSLRAFVALWLFLVGLWAVVLQLPMCRAVTKQARPLAGLALIFLCSYASFWLYFLNPLVGYAISVVTVAIAVVGWLLIIRQCNDPIADDIVTPMVLLGLIGVFSVSMLTLIDGPLLLPQLARLRFTAGLSIDNSIPGLFADRLYAGHSPKHLLGGAWLSSDRPPLQTGWVLLSRPLCEWLSIDHDASTYMAGVIAQLVWVPATWWTIRWLGLPAGTAAFSCVMFATTGFFLQNTVYAWPKLLSGSMAIGAGLLMLDDEDSSAPRAVRWPWAAAFAALATLAHGGAWFSNLALIPFFFARQPLGSLQTTLAAFGIGAGLVLPWMAYQKLYEPPGDRLLKWHLAGQIQPDDRRLAAVVAEAYGKKTLNELIAARSQNLTMQFGGDFRDLVDSRTERMLPRRADEWKYSLRAVGWWNLGWLLYPGALYFGFQNSLFRKYIERWNRLVLWSVATVVVWLSLMFMPGTATIISGSYALEAMLFILPAALLSSTSVGLLLGISLLSTGMFISTWAPVAPFLLGAGYLAPAVLLALASWIIAVGLSNPCCGPEGLRAPTGNEV